MKRSFGLFVAAMFLMHANSNVAAERGVLIHNGFGTGQDFLGFRSTGTSLRKLPYRVTSGLLPNWLGRGLVTASGYLTA
jgi:hypothetical protein